MREVYADGLQNGEFSHRGFHMKKKIYIYILKFNIIIILYHLELAPRWYQYNNCRCSLLAAMGLSSVQCTVKTYLEWLQDSEHSKDCRLCNKPRSSVTDRDDVHIRLPCCLGKQPYDPPLFLLLDSTRVCFGRPFSACQCRLLHSYLL